MTEELSLTTEGKSVCRWFVVATKPRREASARTNLQRQGYEVLYPSIKLKKRYQSRWQMVVEPMFPGYLFLSLTKGEDDFTPVRSTPGCFGLVRFGGTPACVPSTVIKPLIELGDSPLTVSAPIMPGDKVRFEEGPFQGMEGTYDLTRGSDRAQVLLTLLGRDNLVLVDSDQLSKFD